MALGEYIHEKTGPQKSQITVPLKGQCHVIFELCFFHESIGPRLLMNTLKYFSHLLRFCGGIHKKSFT
jgi:hypothetical protein